MPDDKNAASENTSRLGRWACLRLDFLKERAQATLPDLETFFVESALRRPSYTRATIVPTKSYSCDSVINTLTI
jgi:hypothetical protein